LVPVPGSEDHHPQGWYFNEHPFSDYLFFPFHLFRVPYVPILPRFSTPCIRSSPRPGHRRLDR